MKILKPETNLNNHPSDGREYIIDHNGLPFTAVGAIVFMTMDDRPKIPRAVYLIKCELA